MAGKVNKTSPAYIRRKGDADKALAQASRNLEVVLDWVRDLNQDALVQVAEAIKKDAQALTPVDTGALRNSAFVDSEMTPTGPRAVVGFAPEGQGPDYTVFVHERREVYHKPPTQAGFLLAAWQKWEGRIADLVAKKIKEKLK
jgi:hypothetical protein